MKETAKKILHRIGLRRHHVAAARMYCERRALAIMTASRNRKGGRILCYHSVGQPVSGTNDVTPAQFRRQIEQAINLGFRFVPASEIARTGGGPMDLAITFDDAWSSVRTQAAPILADYAIPWSVFAVTDWCEQKTAWTKEAVLSWGDLEYLVSRGAEVGSHSATHPDFAKISSFQIIDELERSREAIETRLGFTPKSFAIPYGQSMNWPSEAHQTTRDAGYEIIYAQAEETRPSGTIARTFITCFDGERNFKAALEGVYDRWEEWV